MLSLFIKRKRDAWMNGKCFLRNIYKAVKERFCLHQIPYLIYFWLDIQIRQYDNDLHLESIQNYISFVHCSMNQNSPCLSFWIIFYKTYFFLLLGPRQFRNRPNIFFHLWLCCPSWLSDIWNTLELIRSEFIWEVSNGPPLRSTKLPHVKFF